MAPEHPIFYISKRDIFSLLLAMLMPTFLFCKQSNLSFYDFCQCSSKRNHWHANFYAIDDNRIILRLGVERVTSNIRIRVKAVQMTEGHADKVTFLDSGLRNASRQWKNIGLRQCQKHVKYEKPPIITKAIEEKAYFMS